MSVLLEFAMFPTDKGASVSQFVSRIIKTIRDSGFEYKLTAMGTIVETENLSDALAVVRKAYDALEDDCDRVYSNLKLDIRKNKSNRLKHKIESIESKIGKVDT